MVFESLPREAGIATWRDLRQPCVPARSIAGIASAMLFGALRLVPLFPTTNLGFLHKSLRKSLFAFFNSTGQEITMPTIPIRASTRVMSVPEIVSFSRNARYPKPPT